MDIEGTLKLIEAGFSADEIRAMAAEKQGEPESENGSGKEAKGEAKQSAPDPEHAGKVEPKNDETVEALKAKIDELTNTIKGMQDNNIKNAEGGNGNPPKTKETVMKDFMNQF